MTTELEERTSRERAVTLAADWLEAALAEREAAIRAAAEAGISNRRIAELAGLSHTGVAKILARA